MFFINPRLLHLTLIGLVFAILLNEISRPQKKFDHRGGCRCRVRYFAGIPLPGYANCQCLADSGGLCSGKSVANIQLYWRTPLPLDHLWLYQRYRLGLAVHNVLSPLLLTGFTHVYHVDGVCQHLFFVLRIHEEKQSTFNDYYQCPDFDALPDAVDFIFKNHFNYRYLGLLRLFWISGKFSKPWKTRKRFSHFISAFFISDLFLSFIYYIFVNMVNFQKRISINVTSGRSIV